MRLATCAIRQGAESSLGGNVSQDQQRDGMDIAFRVFSSAAKVRTSVTLHCRVYVSVAVSTRVGDSTSKPWPISWHDKGELTGRLTAGLANCHLKPPLPHFCPSHRGCYQRQGLEVVTLKMKKVEDLAGTKTVCRLWGCSGATPTEGLGLFWLQGL